MKKGALKLFKKDIAFEYCFADSLAEDIAQTFNGIRHVERTVARAIDHGWARKTISK